ncbi:SigE family RNA polymerase sigma factor [Planobispora siamensis]|uniref:RNA polymerase sigma-70 factor, sigma-E family n=1 Tax=Planobispora siamensis TaxID=936338 RepID=A0A8J3WL59_9ACTN|nr:SigE family RNA polymerase sigma factor [Planobispora siamensis]GIH94909.1 hypothetical protein Psi01_55390 [Planobispora siamensis]
MEEMRDEEFAYFVRTIRPTLRRAAFQLSEDWYEADDLVQRTLMAIHRRWDALDRHDGMGAYAHRVMRRLLISDRRSLRWSREVLTEPLPDSVPAWDPYVQVGERLVLMEALAGLGPRQRAAVVLRYWEDRSVEETARAMGSGSSTVRSQTVRALNALRSALGGGGGGGGADSGGGGGGGRNGRNGRNAEDAPDGPLSGPCEGPELNEVGNADAPRHPRRPAEQDDDARGVRGHDHPGGEEVA